MYMNFRLCFLGIYLLLAFIPLAEAQHKKFQKLSNDAVFSLITCTPGTDLYNQFGHSAIRLKDKNLDLDFVYNFGTFDFETPNFGMKFVERKLMYTLSKSSFRPFLNSYVVEGRGVSEQKLNIDSTQRQKLFETLETNYLPQNREYLYDFFYDNCATRIRDVIETVGKVRVEEPKSKKTFRAYLDEYINHDPWLDFGIDLILGMEADEICTNKMQMFLPDYLSENLDISYLNDKKLLSEIVWILPKPNKKPFQLSFTPLMFSGSILLLGIIMLLVKQNLILKIYEISFLSILFLAGLFLLFMWFGTDHVATQKNLNVLWANPFYILWIFTAYRKNISKFARYNGYFLLSSNAIALLMFVLPVQQFNVAVLPIILLSIIALCRTLFINTLKK